MAMGRSWLRRGLTSPSPWGESVPPLWADTQVLFYRIGAVDDEFGGFASGGATITFLDIMAHVSLQTESGLTTERTELGWRRRRFYDVQFDITPDFDWDLMPRPGDRMAFVDPAGRTIDLRIKSADLPENLPDHVEIESDTFE